MYPSPHSLRTPPVLHCVCLLLLGLPCWAQTAGAWGRLGHNAVAQVAEHFLSDEARAATQVLLEGATLDSCATWADDVRNQNGYAWIKPLHYANVAEGAAHFELGRDCNPTTGCIVSALREEIATLRSVSATTESRRLALRLLVHFVGDVHQPLHVSRAADRGGNTILVSYHGTTTTLHALWDAALIESRYSSPEQLVTELLGSITPALRDQWSSMDPVAWADASYQYAMSNAYALPPGNVIDAAYEQRNLPVMRLRLAQAGVRLAAVLNSVFAAPRVARAPRTPEFPLTMPVAANASTLATIQ